MWCVNFAVFADYDIKGERANGALTPSFFHVTLRQLTTQSFPLPLKLRYCSTVTDTFILCVCPTTTSNQYSSHVQFYVPTTHSYKISYHQTLLSLVCYGSGLGSILNNFDFVFLLSTTNDGGQLSQGT